jgi:hypothetical protein
MKRQPEEPEQGPKKQIYVYRSQSQKERWEKIKKEEDERKRASQTADEKQKAYDQRRARALSMDKQAPTPSTPSQVSATGPTGQ